jgi:hypothetical protein
MKLSKGADHVSRKRETLIHEIERVIGLSRRILHETKADVRRIRRELAHVGRWGG